MPPDFHPDPLPVEDTVDDLLTPDVKEEVKMALKETTLVLQKE